MSVEVMADDLTRSDLRFAVDAGCLPSLCLKFSSPPPMLSCERYKHKIPIMGTNVHDPHPPKTMSFLLTFGTAREVGWKEVVKLQSSAYSFSSPSWSSRLDLSDLSATCGVKVSHQNVYQLDIVLMEEILHHLLSMKTYEKWDILQINWCRISSINSIKTFLIRSFNIIFTFPISKTFQTSWGCDSIN